MVLESRGSSSVLLSGSGEGVIRRGASSRGRGQRGGAFVPSVPLLLTPHQPPPNSEPEQVEWSTHYEQHSSPNRFLPDSHHPSNSNANYEPTAGTTPQQQHVVNYHINQGEMVSLELGDGQLRVISGPAQIRMVSTNSGPPQAIPMQPPPGHIVQQILDQNGTLQHVILSLDPSVNPPAGAPTPYVPMHPYGLPSGGSCISNGQSGGGGVPPFGAPPPPPTYVPSTGPRPGSSGGHHQYPPPVISPSPGCSGTAIPPSSSGPTSTTSSSWSSQQQHHGGERRVRGPTHERLLRKSRHRLMANDQGATAPNNPPSSPPTSPSIRNTGKDVKTYGKKDKSPGGGAMDDSEESGVGHEEEEDKETQQLLLELLSNIQAPKESNVTARGAVISWEPPEIEASNPKFEGLEPIPPSEFTYEVLLSDKGKEGRYRSVFKDESLNCRLPDLRPNTEYHIRIHALLDNLKGGASDTVSFRTLPSEPDTPFPPKVASKSKTSINLRWNAPSDNGSSIQSYILEMDEGAAKSSSAFSPIFNGRAKNYNVTKLSPATPYRFRLLAVNEFGASRPSETLVVVTQGAPPARPLPPGLKEATKSSLHLLWSKRLTDSEFVLQQNDVSSGHGYISVYSGPDYASLSTGLRRNTSYKFRLRACNSEGESQWSEEVSFSTLPDVPGRPGKVAPKGKLHAHSFKVRWDPPGDDGGSPVSQYNLELDEGSGWRTVYQGPELESVCDALSPGRQYAVRVSCQSSGGVSEYSDACTILTEPVRPGQCPPPRLHGKPKADHLALKWSWPESDGGSRITDFEIDMTSPDNTTASVYKGRDTECTVASLLPGRPYLFVVRAHNRAGPGPWSDTLEVVSGAGVPGQPKEPKFSVKSPSCVLFTWEAPINNGALVTEYVLELANLTPPVEDESDTEDEEDENVQEDDASEESFSEEDSSEEDSEEEASSDGESGDSEAMSVPSDDVEKGVPEVREPEFVVAYRGANASFEARSLRPASSYLFRLAAFNSAGKGPYSEAGLELTTPPAPPAQISSLRLRKKGATWLSLDWKAPDHQGEEITLYRVETSPPVSPGTFSTAETAFTLPNLKPDTSYSVRVQAVNAMGSGPFSQSHRFATTPLPPAPPRIEGINANHNSLKLKWGDAKSLGLLHYNLEMENSRHQFQSVYSGSMVSHKVNKLAENTVYRFRITAFNEAGQGPYSPITELTTLYAHPPPLKSVPRVSSITSDGCLVEWTPLKHQLQGVLHYKVSLTKVKEQDSKIIYCGGDPSFRVSGLEARTEYSVRVLPVRVPAPEVAELVGPSSSPGIFTTLGGGDPSRLGGGPSSGLLSASGKVSSVGSTKPEKKAFSDQQWAFLILVGFSVFAMLVAVLMHQIIGWSKDDESGD